MVTNDVLTMLASTPVKKMASPRLGMIIDGYDLSKSLKCRSQLTLSLRDTDVSPTVRRPIQGTGQNRLWPSATRVIGKRRKEFFLLSC